MPTLRELIQGKNPDREAQVRKESEDFQRRMGMPDAPEEEGIREESSFIPNMDTELQEKGWLMGAAPPIGGAAGEAGETTRLGRLRAAGFDREKLATAGEDLRMGNAHTFTGPKGEPIMTVRPGSDLGDELAELGRSRIQSANSRASGFNYSRLPENRTVNPRK